MLRPQAVHEQAGLCLESCTQTVRNDVSCVEVIKYAGVASLQNYLKTEGLIQDLSSADSSTSAGTRFLVAMYLTTKGPAFTVKVFEVVRYRNQAV